MQSFACFIAVAVFATVATAASVGSSQQLIPHNILQTLTEESNININAPSELARLKKSTYSAPVPSVPCPKSYLFSCQSHVASTPCAQQSYAGAYSAPVPTYALPQAHHGIPQELLRPTRFANQYLW